jgi:hypothetical protein
MAHIVEAPSSWILFRLSSSVQMSPLWSHCKRVTGFQKLLPGTSTDPKGRLRTRLLQVLVKDGGEWKIAAYHNYGCEIGSGSACTARESLKS